MMGVGNTRIEAKKGIWRGKERDMGLGLCSIRKCTKAGVIGERERERGIGYEDTGVDEEAGAVEDSVSTPVERQAGQLFLPFCNHSSTQFLWNACRQDISRSSWSGS